MHIITRPVYPFHVSVNYSRYVPLCMSVNYSSIPSVRSSKNTAYSSLWCRGNFFLVKTNFVDLSLLPSSF